MPSIELVSNLKYITSGLVPTTEALSEGEFAFGLVGGVPKLFGNVGGVIQSFTPDSFPLSDSLPLMDGTASAGSALSSARADHKHPTDTSRASSADLQAEISARQERDSAFQSALDGKQSMIIGAASTVTLNNLTTNRVLISDANGKISISPVTSTELGYLSGAKSNIQQQVDEKYIKPVMGIPKVDLSQDVQTSLDHADSALQSVPDASASQKGIVTLGASGGAARYGQKGDVGLGNVDNTSDMNKPVSTAQAAAINAKYTKPSTGIPKTDLSQSVQNSIDKAENAATSADLDALRETVNNNSESVENIVNNTTKIAETNFGGFSAGENSSATTGGGAVGSDASTLSGGAVGSGANSTTGGAVGLGAYTTTGFAGGYMAKASANGAVQLGEGTNTNANTLQFRGYQIVDASGNIPSERLKNAALKKTWDDLAQYTYSGSGSLPNNILYPTMAFGDCEYREIIGADFNDIINNGHYVIRTNSTHVAAHAPINGSTSTATNGVWHLIVLRYTETFIRQIAIDVRNGTNAIQVRNCFNSSWGEWKSLLYNNNSITRLMSYTTSTLTGNRTLSEAYYNYAFIIVRYYPASAAYWVEDIIPVDYLAEYPGTSSARRVLTTQTTNGWCNYWFSSGTTFNWNAGDMYRVEVYAY